MDRLLAQDTAPGHRHLATAPYDPAEAMLVDMAPDRMTPPPEQKELPL